MQQMIARGDFGNDAAVLLMLGNLRSYFARKEFTIAQNRDRGFIARSFEGKDRLHVVGAAVSAAQPLSRSPRRRQLQLSLWRLDLGPRLLGVNHHAFERVDRTHRL